MEHFTSQTFAYYFLSLLLEGAPFILIGTFISGFIDAYLPSGTLEKFLPENKFLAILLAGFIGLFIPVCECAIIPVIRRLIAKGLPVSCAFTYMLAAPIVNPITALSTWSAFSSQNPLLVTTSRLSIGYLAAIIVGLIILRIPVSSILKSSLKKEIVSSNHHCCDGPHHINNRFITALRSGLNDFVDVASYFTIGVCLTALFNILYISHFEMFSHYSQSTFISPLILIFISFVLSVCSTSDAFLVATLISFTAAAKMAFMTLGPMLDIKLLFLYSTILKRKFLLFFSLGLLLLLYILCIIWGSLI